MTGAMFEKIVTKNIFPKMVKIHQLKNSSRNMNTK